MHVFVTLFENDAFNTEMLVSVSIGLIVGAISSLIINVALVEISLNSFFAVYYGLFFLMFGGMLIYRGLSLSRTSITSDFPAKKQVLISFGFFTFLSGLVCILLDKNWFASIGPLTKIPMYMILGSSICFVIVLAVIDIVNYIGGHIGKMNYRSLIDKPSQILALTVISLVTGAIYGLIFGCMNVASADHFIAQLVLLKEEKYCLVIGIMLGAMGGMINELARKNMTRYFFTQIPKDPFEEEI